MRDKNRIREGEKGKKKVGGAVDACRTIDRDSSRIMVLIVQLALCS